MFHGAAAIVQMPAVIAALCAAIWQLQPASRMCLPSCLHTWSMQTTAPVQIRFTCNRSCKDGHGWVCRAIITAHSCLLFEPNNPQSKKFLECVTPRLTANEGARVLAEYRRDHDDYSVGESQDPPFELEMVEGALMVATGNCKLIVRMYCILLTVYFFMHPVAGICACMHCLHLNVVNHCHDHLEQSPTGNI